MPASTSPWRLSDGSQAPPHTRLEAAKAAHDAAEREIAQLEAKRNDALLADRDDEAASLADQIETLRRLIRGHQDKIALLQAEAQRVEGERAAKQKLELIERIEKKFMAREAVGAEPRQLPQRTRCCAS